MKQPAPVMCVALLVAASASPAAWAWLSSKELQRSCEAFLADSKSEVGAQCVAYVQGYLTASDPARTLRDHVESDETFSERAARQRLGTLRLQGIRGLDDVYCVDDDVPAARVVREVMAYLEEKSGTGDLTDAQAVREALAARFPCDGD